MAGDTKGCLDRRGKEKHLYVTGRDKNGLDISENALKDFFKFAKSFTRADDEANRFWWSEVKLFVVTQEFVS